MVLKAPPPRDRSLKRKVLINTQDADKIFWRPYLAIAVDCDRVEICVCVAASGRCCWITEALQASGFGSIAPRESIHEKAHVILTILFQKAHPRLRQLYEKTSTIASGPQRTRLTCESDVHRSPSSPATPALAC